MEKVLKIQDLCVVLELATMDSVTLLFTILNLKKELLSIKVFLKGLKGQLISKCLFCVIVLTKIATKIL